MNTEVDPMDEAVNEVAEILGVSEEKVLKNLDTIRRMVVRNQFSIEDAVEDVKDVLGEDIEDAPEEQKEVKMVQPKAGKKKCKVCGFAKKSRRVGADGVCKSCRVAVDSGESTVEVIGRMGKRGRNSVSVVIDGQRFTVKRYSSKHSERIAERYASKPKGYAKRAKRTGSAPKGLPTDSRIGADREQRTPDA